MQEQDDTFGRGVAVPGRFHLQQVRPSGVRKEPRWPATPSSRTFPSTPSGRGPPVRYSKARGRSPLPSTPASVQSLDLESRLAQADRRGQPADAPADDDRSSRHGSSILIRKPGGASGRQEGTLTNDTARIESRKPSSGRKYSATGCSNCAGRNRTPYLQVMSLASYRCSTAQCYYPSRNLQVKSAPPFATGGLQRPSLEGLDALGPSPSPRSAGPAQGLSRRRGAVTPISPPRPAPRVSCSGGPPRRGRRGHRSRLTLRRLVT